MLGISIWKRKYNGGIYPKIKFNGRKRRKKVILSDIMWSKDNNLLCGLLIKLAESDEFHLLEVDEDNFLSISERIENSSVISRKITGKI